MAATVTCIIPTRNRAPLLSRAMESIVNQTYSDVSVVIVDDHSTDGTEDVVREFAARMGDRRVRHIRNPRPLGAAASRNVGIRTANSPYLAFLDDDDEWLPSKIEMQLRHRSHFPLVGSRIRRIRSERPLARRLKYWCQGFEPSHTIISAEDLLESNCGMSPSSIVVDTDKVRQIGGFDDSLAANQGRDFLIRFALKFGPVLRVNERLVLQHQDHDLGRISERGGKRHEAMEIVHRRFRDRMPRWLERYDRARISLSRARLASHSERREFEKQALACFHPRHPIRFVRLYLAYLRDRLGGT